MAITPRGADQYMIRFPDGLRDRLKEAAKDNARSMNSEVITRLEASFTVAREVNSEVAALLERHIEAEVSARLKAIAAQITA